MFRRVAVLSALMMTHAGLAGWLCMRYGATCDEVGHLAAGLSVWEGRGFELYCVNPPLVRTIAAIPVGLRSPRTEWGQYLDRPTVRPEWLEGLRLIKANSDDWFACFSAARLAVLPFSLLAAVLAFRWSRDLHGPAAAIVALLLWCFSANVLAWAATITPDVAATSLGLLAGWLLWRWLRKPSWTSSLAAGLGLGIAELAKMTWVMLFALWPMLWAFWRATESCVEQSNDKGVEECNHPKNRRRPPIRQLVLILVMGFYIINVGYLFEGSLKPLGEYTFVSELMTGKEPPPEQGGKRFTRTWLGAIPTPLPESYVSGMDLQKLDFEKGMPSYLNGRWWHGGWWYYYLYCVLLKVPLGTQVLFVMAVIMSVSGVFKGRRAAKRAEGLRQREVEHSTFNGGDEERAIGKPFTTDHSPLIPPVTLRDTVVLLAPAVAVFVLVSSQTGFSRYFRYVLPCFPFVFIYVSRVAIVFERPSPPLFRAPRTALRNRIVWLKVTVAGCLAWSVISSLSVYPHSMSYFNKLAGGPKGGHRYLLDSNIDWGQDLWYLKEWYDRNPQARPLHLAAHALVHPRHYRIAFERVPQEPQPGWYALSINHIRGHLTDYEFFLHYKPVAMAGYSIYIYNLTREQANRLRREMGLSVPEARPQE